MEKPAWASKRDLLELGILRYVLELSIKSSTAIGGKTGKTAAAALLWLSYLDARWADGTTEKYKK